MSCATEDSVHVDPSLSTLVPRRSLLRNVALSAIGAVAMLAAWTSPALLRPSVVSSENLSGSWTAILTHDQVLAVAQLHPDAWNGVSVQSVSEVPGSQLAGVWVVVDGLANFDGELDEASFPSGIEYLEAAFEPGALDATTAALPQDVDDEATTHLVILWNITDCAQLDADALPQVELRSFFGTTTHQELGTFASPAFDIPTLVENGICPAN